MQDNNMGYEFGTEEEKKKYVRNPSRDVPPTELEKDCPSHLIVGERMLLSFLTMKAGSTFAVHSHPHEQIMTVLEGSCDQILGDKIFRVEKGDVLYMPPGLEHGSILRDEDCVVIDVFVPARELHIEKFRAQNPDAKLFFLDS